jgi:hypothetical protein
LRAGERLLSIASVFLMTCDQLILAFLNKKAM